MNKTEKPKITISDPIHEAINRVNKAIWAIVSILVIGFITMLLMVTGLVLDAWRFKSNSYESLIETIRSQEKIINENRVQQDELKRILNDTFQQFQISSQVIRFNENQNNLK